MAAPSTDGATRKGGRSRPPEAFEEEEMTQAHDAARRSARPVNPARVRSGDPQVDEETGGPVAVVPDGEKANDPAEVPPEARLRIDPESRIPRPVQPDLA